MKKLILIFLLSIGSSSKAQDTQTLIDSIMTLYPNCTDYPVEVLIVLDSLLVALASEESISNEINYQVDDTLFLSYLSTYYPNIIENGQLNPDEASMITDLNLDNLGLNNINGIEYFTNLESLSCENNNLTIIPELPNNLLTINFQWNNINVIESLPSNLINLDLRHNSLNSIPELPNNIENLKLCFNDFTSIPSLPDSLRILFFAYNDLVNLPTFPIKIEQVLCYNNQINNLDVLPESLEILRVQNNNITYLPNIPNGIETLDISNNPIECVNSFPIHLEEQLANYQTCIIGCIDSTALNYDSNVILSDNSCEYNQVINWPSNHNEINTDANATYLIENLLFNDSIVSFGYTIGAFYQNDFGGLSCGGFSQWNGAPSSIAVYKNDLSTDKKDGFDTGDQIVWLAYSTDSTNSNPNTNHIASANYITGSDLYTANSINLISNFNIYTDTISIYGCTDELATNYYEFSFIDDSSCIFPPDTDIIELSDSISYLLTLIDSLNSELEIISQNPNEIISSLQLELETWNTSISIQEGWNMFGYGCPTEINIIEGLNNYIDYIILVKDNNGVAYLPEWDFNGIGNLTPGFGYQMKILEAIDDFSLCDWYINNIIDGN